MTGRSSEVSLVLLCSWSKPMRLSDNTAVTWIDDNQIPTRGIMSVPLLPAVPTGPRVSMPVVPPAVPGDMSRTAVPVPAVPKAATRGAHSRLTSLPYDSLRLRFRPSPPRDLHDSPPYGWLSFVCSCNSPTLPGSSGQRMDSPGEEVKSSPHPPADSLQEMTRAKMDRGSHHNHDQQKGKRMNPPDSSTRLQSRKCAANRKENAEPQYRDAGAGGPACFQRRLGELGVLEADTVRWERSRRRALRNDRSSS